MRSSNKRANSIVERARGYAASDRAAFLDGACGEDAELRAQVERLLSCEEPTLPTAVGGAGEAILQANPTRPDPIAEVPLTVRAGSVIGRYRLLEKLGEGGFGAVWAAEQREPVKRRVALKIIKLGMDTKQVVARFEAERQALALMDHPNIAKVLDAGSTDSGRPFFVMELVKGIPITRYCNQEKLSLPARLDLFIQVCQAIQHAHQKGIIHRDVKPSNILVTLRDGVPVPKVIDFGIAKATQQELTELTIYTQHHQMIGTPAYMSPEQAEMSGLDIDTRSDIYSLGVLLYELLTGFTPFDTAELLEAGLDEMRKILRQREPVRPSTRLGQTLSIAEAYPSGPSRHSSLHTDLDWIVMKCLEKDRARRYETANALRLDVHRFLDNEPVTAVAPSVLYKLSKFARRNRVVFVASASVAVALLIGSTVATWQAFRANRSAHTAAQRTGEAVVARNEALEAQSKEREQRELAEANERRTHQLKYASDIIVAQNALRDMDTKLGMDLLLGYVPEPGDQDLRGWEWRYLLGQFSQEDKVERVLEEAHELAVSTDGRWLAVTGGGKTGISILSIPGLEVRQKLRLPSEVQWVSGMFFNADSSQLVVECFGQVGVVQFDLETGESSPAVVGGFAKGRVTRLSPGGEYVVAMHHRGELEHELRCFDSSSGRRLATSVVFTVPDGSMIDHEFRVSPDGTMASASVAGRELMIFSVPELKTVGRIETHGEVKAVAWSPDNRWIATGYEYPYATDVWGVGGAYRGRLPGQQKGPTEDLWISSDGALIAVCTLPNTIFVCKTDDLGLVRALGGHRDGEIATAVILGDNATVASAGILGTVKLWDTTTPPQSAFAALSETSNLWHLRYSPEGGRLAAKAPTGRVHLFDARSEELLFSLDPVQPVEGRHPEYPWQAQLAFLSDGSLLAASNGDHTASVYDLDSRSLRFVLDGHSRPLVNIRVSSDDRFFVTTGEDNLMVLWDTATGKKVREIDGPRHIDCHPYPDSPLIAAGEHGSVSLINTHTQKRHTLPINGSVWSVTFSPDGKMLAVGMTSAVRLYSVPDLELKDTILGPPGPIPMVAFHPDGGTIAIPAWGGTLHLWNAQVRATVGRLPLPSDWTIGAHFSPDGNTLAVSTRGKGNYFYRAPAISRIEAW